MKIVKDKWIVLTLSLGLLGWSFTSQDLTKRSLASLGGVDCEPKLNINTIPIQKDLVEKVSPQPPVLNAEYFYQLLKSAQLNYFAGLESARASYGLSGSIWGEIPKITVNNPMFSSTTVSLGASFSTPQNTSLQQILPFFMNPSAEFAVVQPLQMESNRIPTSSHNINRTLPAPIDLQQKFKDQAASAR